MFEPPICQFACIGMMNQRLGYLIAPLIAPLVWFSTFLLVNAVEGRLTTAAIIMRTLFFIVMIIGSYATAIPLLFLWAKFLPHREKVTLFDYVIAACLSLFAGVIYSSPAFLDASRIVQGCISLIFFLMISAFAFVFITTLFSDEPSVQTRGKLLEALTGSRGSDFGPGSLLSGAVAIGMAIAANYGNSQLGINSGTSKIWLSPGNTTSPNIDVIFSNRVEFAASSVYDVNAQNLVVWYFAGAAVLAISAIGCAFAAAYRREDSLYRSAGLLCGCLALTVISPLIGLSAALACCAMALLVETSRRPS